MYEKVVEDLRRAYNRAADERQQAQLSAWKVEERQAFLELLHAEGKQSMLEIGAGPGKDSLFFQQNGLQVICSDLAAEMVALCRAKGLEAYEMDFKNLAFPSEHFDAVYAFNCLLHVPKRDLPEVLAAINRLLKWNGLFFMAVYGGPESEEVWAEDHHEPQRFFSFYTDEQLLTVVTGFFELVDFKCLEPEHVTESELHAQRLVLRKV